MTRGGAGREENLLRQRVDGQEDPESRDGDRAQLVGERSRKVGPNLTYQLQNGDRRRSIEDSELLHNVTVEKQEHGQGQEVLIEGRGKGRDEAREETRQGERRGKGKRRGKEQVRWTVAQIDMVLMNRSSLTE